MAIEHDQQGKPDSTLRLGTKKLPQARAKQSLSLAAAPRQSTARIAGSDPYNTSGSFDRKKHWERVGKR